LNNVLDTMVNSALFQTGAWSQYTSYAPLDIVEYAGNAYVANAANVNIIPSTDPNTWTPFSSASAVAGLSGYIQYNNGSGGLAASSNLTFDGTNLNAPVTPTGTTTARTLANLFGDIVSVKDFGAVGDGVTNDTASINAAIAAANSSTKGFTIYFPVGKYLVLTGLNPVTANGVYFVGEGDASSVLLGNAGTIIQFGTSAQVTGGGVQNLGFTYVSTPNSNAIAIKVGFAARLTFSNITIENGSVFASLGTSASYTAAIIMFNNIKGYVYNGGKPCFDIRYGAGVFIDSVSLYVGGVNAPVYPALMTTVADTNFINVTTGGWDTIILSNILAERFYVGFDVVATSVVINDIWMTNVVFDTCRNCGIFLETNGGSIVGIHVSNSWFNSWEATCIYHNVVTGRINSVQYDNCKVLLAGANGFIFVPGSGEMANFSITNTIIYGVNKNNDGSSNIIIGGGCTGFVIANNNVGYDATSLGLPYRGLYGIGIGSDCDKYQITGNVAEGSVAGYSIPQTNTAASVYRSVKTNVGTGYVGSVTVTVPASNVAWYNKTPFELEVFIAGGTVSGLAKNSINLNGVVSGSILVGPGEYLTITYSSVPNVTAIILQ